VGNVYAHLSNVAGLAARLYLAVSHKHRPLKARFSPPIPAGLVNPIWVHACSVGEVRTAVPLIRRMAMRAPGSSFLLTTSTQSGMASARDLANDFPITWCPFDAKVVVNDFFERLKPSLLVLVETEIWPNIVFTSEARGVPVVLVNGRLSDKHLPRYARAKALFGPVFQRLTRACMQNGEYAERIEKLGTRKENIVATGNIKFDGARFEADRDAIEALRKTHNFREDDRVIVFGSTRPGDEQMMAELWARMSGSDPKLKLVVVPRHIERAHEAASAFQGTVILRSTVLRHASQESDGVLIVDTMGELANFYACATVAVIGGSFFPGVNGHNPLEPAALGIPTVFGPYMRNFIDPARVLLANNGAVQVENAVTLEQSLRRLLANPIERGEIADRGRAAVRGEQGAIDRTIEVIDSVLRAGERAVQAD
jgi:3-deoxy-D-manno-octulosonic-acid transferase